MLSSLCQCHLRERCSLGGETECSQVPAESESEVPSEMSLRRQKLPLASSLLNSNSVALICISCSSSTSLRVPGVESYSYPLSRAEVLVTEAGIVARKPKSTACRLWEFRLCEEMLRDCLDGYARHGRECSFGLVQGQVS